jgi:uncharacterized protein
MSLRSFSIQQAVARGPLLLGLLAVGTLIGVVAAAPPLPSTVAASASPSGASSKAGPSATYRDITWPNLMPMGWDPMKKFRSMNLGRMSDSSPAMGQMMLELREALDNAPLIDTFDGAAVRIPGYVVPLQNDKDGLKEFLLVPYFGACIHMPPPPANQIIWVKLLRGNKALHSMDAVWVQGQMHVERQSSEMGVSGYQMTDASADPYTGRPR